MTSAQPLITEKDAHYLRTLLSSKDHDDAYREIVSRKLAEAAIVSDDAIDPGVATLDSRVEFSVGGGFTESRILTRGEIGPADGLALPVTTPRGLALLGLREGEVFSVRKANGIIEPIRLIRVARQPQAARKSGATGSVVRLEPRRARTLEGVGSAAPAGLGDDDDPGPSAA
ncbi:hypothetical protein [Hyphomicrobium sp.]|uniref:hypothetical protein n=1 Tax=Hyphomicrobium sp. TaxID=82 RepID=UPI002FE19D44